jgi:hypothetical protein
MCSVFVYFGQVTDAFTWRGSSVGCSFHYVLGHNLLRVFKYSYRSLTNHASLRPADCTTHLLSPTFVSILRPNLFTKTLTLARTNSCGSICRANMHCMLVLPEDIYNARVIYCRGGTHACASCDHCLLPYCDLQQFSPYVI